MPEPDLNYSQEMMESDQGDPKEFETKLLTLVEDLEKAKTDQSEFEGKVKDCKSKVTDLTQKKIPDHMGQATEWKGAGYVVKVKEDLFCSIRKTPDDMTDAAIRHLESIGHGTSVKREISLTFGTSKVTDAIMDKALPQIRDFAQQVLTQLLVDEQKKTDAPDMPVSVEVDAEKGYAVNAQTLKKIAKEQQEAGFKMPDKIYSSYAFRKAEVKPAKKK